MNQKEIQSIVKEYAANKEEADRLTARNCELAERMQELASFAPGSETARLEAAGFRVTITRRINEKWDQKRLADLRMDMTDDLFFMIFREKYEPDKKALRAFMRGQSDGKFKSRIIDACTTSSGRPSIKLESVEA